MTQRELTLYALRCVQQVADGGAPDCSWKDYRTVVLGLAPMILESGLAQTCGFLLAKGQPHHHWVLRHLASLVNYGGQAVSVETARAWFEQLLAAKPANYRWQTRRALQAAVALKRHVQAMS